MSLLTHRLFRLLLIVIVVQAQHDTNDRTLEEQVTLWKQFFDRLAAPGIENVLRRLPILASLTPTPPIETTTPVFTQVTVSEPVQQFPQDLVGDGRPGSNISTADDDNSTNSILDLGQNENSNYTTFNNDTNLSTNDIDSNNTTFVLNDADFDDRNETFTSESPRIIGEERHFREESKRILFQQTDQTGTPGATFNLNANSNSYSDPNISNGFSPTNILAGLSPLVLPLINSVGVGLSQHHLDVIEAQKKRLALLNAPRPYSPPDGELPGFGTALFNELVENRRPGGFGSALANDLARSEQSSNGIEAAKISPPLAYPQQVPTRPPVRGLPVYPRASALSNAVPPRNFEPLSANAVLPRNVEPSSPDALLPRNIGPPSPRRRYSAVPESIRRGSQIPRLTSAETRFTDVRRLGGQPANNWNPVAQVTARSSSAYNSPSTLNEFDDGSSRFPEVPSLSPEEADVEQDGQFLGTALDHRSGPTGDHGFGSAFPDYSNLPGSDLVKEVSAPPFSYAAPTTGELSGNDQWGSSNQQGVSEQFPRLAPESHSNQQETSFRESAATSFPQNDNQKPPLFPDTFSLRADGSGDFVAGSGIVASEATTRGPPPGVFGSGRQPDESIFNIK